MRLHDIIRYILLRQEHSGKRGEEYEISIKMGKTP